MNSKILTWVVSLLVIALGVWFFMQQGSISLVKQSKSSKYQAVFLSNGQVYFGQVSNEAADPVVLKDIYYLRVQQQLQPPKEGTNAQPQIQLIKLGNELHGPQDEMRINRRHILFIEDLKDDGKVVAAIKEFQRNGGTDVKDNQATEKKTKESDVKSDQATEKETKESTSETKSAE